MINGYYQIYFLLYRNDNNRNSLCDFFLQFYQILEPLKMCSKHFELNKPTKKHFM